MISYNQILKIFGEIADAHLQIKQFGAGDPADIPEGVSYPLTWVVYDPSEINLSYRSNEISFKVLCADLLHEDKSNEHEILSDQKQTACDIIAQLQLQAYRDVFEVSDIVKLEPIVESITTDSIAGWLMSLTLRTDYLSNACEVPSTLEPGELPGCPPVTIVDSEGYTIAIVETGLSHVITDSNVHNSDNSYSVNVKPQHSLSLPDTTIFDSAGNVLHTVPATQNQGISDSNVRNADGTYSVDVLAEQNLVLPDSEIRDTAGNLLYTLPATNDQTIADSNVRNSDATYSIDVLSEQNLILPDSEIHDSAGNLLYTVPATQDQVIADTTIKNSAGTTIGTGHAESIITLPDKTLSNSNGSYTSPIVQGLDKTLADISITEGDGVARTYPAAINVTTSQRTFEHVITLSAGSFLQAGFQIASQGTIKSVTLTNVASYTVKLVRAGTITTVTTPFAVQKDDIIQVTATPTNSAQDCILDFLGYHDVLSTSQTLPAKNGDGRYLFVLCVNDQTVYIIDTNGHSVSSPITLPSGKSFGACAYRYLNKTVYTIGLNYVAIIDADPASGTFGTILSHSATVGTTNNQIAGLAYDYIHDKFWVGATNGQLTKLDPGTLTATNLGTAGGFFPPRCEWMQFIAPLRMMFIGDETNGSMLVSVDSEVPVYALGAVYLAGQLEYNFNNGNIYQSRNSQCIVTGSNPIKPIATINNNAFSRGSLKVIQSSNKIYGCSPFNNSIGVINGATNTTIATITKTSPDINETGSRQIVYGQYANRIYVMGTAISNATTGVTRIHIFDPTNDTYQGYVTVGNLESSSSTVYRGHQMCANQLIL